ncbi:MAG: flagellar biosynthesis anti-sigma factor FlgM [Amphritea sp.]
MVMDITGASSNQAANSRGKVTDQSATENKQTNSQSTTETAAATISGINLSDAAQAIQKGVEDQLNDASSVNEQRVAELKMAVENGTYKIDYESTARNLFQIENQLDQN